MDASLTLMQAIMLGGWYWIIVCCFGYTLGCPLDMPVFGSVVVGIIIGDLKQCLLIAATIQPLYLAFTGGGGTVAQDRAAATIVACTITAKTGMEAAMAVNLAVPIGLITAQLHTVRRIWFAYPAQMADKYAAQGNARGIQFMGSWFCHLSKVILFWIPMSLMLYFGTTAVGNLVSNFPAWLENALYATGRMLPCLGFAMTVNVIGRTELLPYFLAGFFFVQYSNVLFVNSISAAVIDETTGVAAMQDITVGQSMPGMALALVGLFLAFLHLTIVMNSAKEKEEEEEAAEAAAEIDESKRLLTKKDAANLWHRWWWFCEMSNSFSRLQSIAVCCAFMPIVKKLYGHDEELYREGLQRHLVFFNTQGVWGSIIFGIVAAMEEQRAMGANMPVEMITGVKAGLMGPFAGIGDTIDWSTLEPILIVLFLPFVRDGQVWAPIVTLALFTGITYAEGYYFTTLGFRLGTQAAVSILESGMVNMLITGAAVLGLFMMGGLSASMTEVWTSIDIPTSGSPMSVQNDILNPILPGILTLIALALTYRYLLKGNSMMKATFWLLGTGFILGTIGIIGNGGLIFKGTIGQ